MSTENTNADVKFERVDGKADFENKPLVILKAKEMEKGATFSGVYKKTIMSEKYGTPAYIIETAENDLLLNGCGSLNKQMANVAVGELIQVEYRGSQPIADGKFKGTQSHLFTVRRAVNSEEAAG